VARVLFEAGLIVLGLLGGLALNEWRESRDRRTRVDALMTAVRAELASNLSLLKEAQTYNRTVVSTLRRLAADGAKETPPAAYSKGLMQRPQLVSAAWDSARASEWLSEVPVRTIVEVARTHEAQRNYMESTARLLDNMYATFLSGEANFLSDPGTLGGVLNDFAGRGEGLITSYESTLKALVEPGR
jgi:hypothetical protein